MPGKVRICFVCLGNICRSPTAEGVMRHIVHQEGLDDTVELDSAGTGDWHVGNPPDERASETARGRGFELAGQARQFRPQDFDRFDYVVAMDRSNRKNLERMAANDAQRAKIHLLRDFDANAPKDAEVPDPYYGGPEGFENVFDVVEAGCRGLLEHVRREHGVG